MNGWNGSFGGLWRHIRRQPRSKEISGVGCVVILFRFCIEDEAVALWLLKYPR
jgi:hypothetical protein